uniref:Uncharacterized protein n=1 Tax=Anopheles albimanus TaxID=7167 RepID=A0A182FZ29_ANOAL
RFRLVAPSIVVHNSHKHRQPAVRVIPGVTSRAFN